jgi:hypothetical protein
VRFLLVFAALSISRSVSLGAVTGSVAGSSIFVNGTPGGYFLGPGDNLFFAASGAYSVGATDPATTFYQYTRIADSQMATVAASGDDVLVQPSGVGGTVDDVLYVVPNPNDNTYYAIVELYYYNSAWQRVDLDYDFKVFSSD